MAPSERRRLLSGFAANHRAWFAACARSIGGRRISVGGVRAVLTPGKELVIPFPRLPRDAPGAALDRLLDNARTARVGQVGVWSLSPDGPPGLGARLAARGFEYGWQAHWMRADLESLRDAPAPPDGVRLGVEDVTEEAVPGLPYWSTESAQVLATLFASRPRRTWRVVAREGDTVLGHVVFFVAPDRPEIAGIYDMGVLEAVRRRGIGRALLHGVFDAARARGCRDALLNSAASDFYRRVGFEHVGHGQTWWLHRPLLESGPLPPDQIAFAEGIGLGRTEALDRLRPDDLDARLACGMTPMELAVRNRTRDAVRWLRERGAFFGPLHAWDMGWRAVAARVLQDDPSSVNRTSGSWNLTPLHEAVQRDDLALADLILGANPDLGAKDSQFAGTPLGWARHLGRTQIARRIEALT